MSSRTFLFFLLTLSIPAPSAQAQDASADAADLAAADEPDESAPEGELHQHVVVTATNTKAAGETTRSGVDLADRNLADTGAARCDEAGTSAVRRGTTNLDPQVRGLGEAQLRSAWRIRQRWTLRAGVENLLDERYADHLNTIDPSTMDRVLEPGRRAYVGLELAF